MDIHVVLLSQEQELILQELEIWFSLESERLQVLGPRRHFWRVVIEGALEVAMEGVFKLVDPGLVLFAIHPRQGAGDELEQHVK